MFDKVLIANRGAIACRILRTLKRLKVCSVAVYSDADRHAMHATLADEAVHIGAACATDSYLDQDKIIAAARATGAQAIHPGYGFLSENASFAERCEREGFVFVGPTPEQMRRFGLKHSAREVALAHDVPLLPGSGLLENVDHAVGAAAQIGYPVMLKSTAGGGGIGMQLCETQMELADAYASVERLAKSNFSQGGVFVEKYVQRARHIEVQIFGDGLGNVIALGERDCSVQRRNQKVIEETPAPHLSESTRERLLVCAERMGSAVAYRSAGTVEFVYDDASDAFYFLEVNTRLQVEHGVTEQVTGVDLVEWMLRVACGDPPDLSKRPPRSGHSIQARLYAEDPAHQFRPSSGLLSNVQLPGGVRVDHWIETGTEVSTHYDPMLAKIIADGESRAAAIGKLDRALAATRVDGIETNLTYLRHIIQSDVFRDGRQFTRFLAELAYRPNTIEVIQPGTHTTVQDYPGRIGYWNIGVPPSGPMDDLAFRFANRLVGNDEAAAGLEMTVSGPTLRFNAPVVFALTGAYMRAELAVPSPAGEVRLHGTQEVELRRRSCRGLGRGHAVDVAFWTAVRAEAGSVLNLRAIEGGGQRTYLAVRGGLDVPRYMNSRATFTLGQFGGHAGRALRAGDTLRVQASETYVAQVAALPSALIPKYEREWRIAVMYGPHGAPDFFTSEDMETFFSTNWEVHYNSSRTGVRLIGPKPMWARADGGEAGLHPSNIHDNAYAIGAIDFTGDMPVILGPDGPSLGGFVCPATIVRGELWKVGQLKPGDKVRFHRISAREALDVEQVNEQAIRTLRSAVAASPAREISPERSSVLSRVAVVPAQSLPSTRSGTRIHPEVKTQMDPRVREDDEEKQRAVLASFQARKSAQGPAPAVCYRQAGDKYLLVEYGPHVLDLELRFRVHALMQWLRDADIEGVSELTPGIRSLQIHYESRTISQQALLKILERAEEALPSVEDVEVPSRIVRLPLSWDDPATRLAIDKYMQSVRSDAPWCPSNLEFIRRINGLDSIDDVRRIFFDASYLVMGLGDVYLGAPVATPLDPRHRLVTTKYNPARTWTPENAVGIGGAYLCVYGMEGPGGYQFVGRTIQMWNRYRQTQDFIEGKQWLLRFFDQLRFYPVSAEELLQLREDFPRGRFKLRIEQSTLRLREYREFLRTHAPSIEAFKARQHAAFEAERERWRDAGQLTFDTEAPSPVAETNELTIPDGANGITSPVAGNVWKLAVQVGQHVNEGDELLVIEAMKMEIPIVADEAGEVIELRAAQGSAVRAGDVLVITRSRKVAA